MLHGVGLGKTSIMGIMLKNLAMTYCEMKEFRKALNYADEATGIRKETLGEDHPDVARSHYFTGSLYMSLGDEEKAKGKSPCEFPLNPFRTKTLKYLFPRGNEPLLYHQIGNINFFIFITNQ